MILATQAAIRKGVSVDCIRRAIKHDQIPGFKEGNFWLVDEDSEQYKKWLPRYNVRRR